MFERLQSRSREGLRKAYADNVYEAHHVLRALPGMLTIGDFKKVKETIVLFVKHQKADGKIPRTIVEKGDVVKLSYTGTREAEFLLLISMAKYLDVTRDYDFVDEYFQHFHDAMMLRTRQTKNKLTTKTLRETMEVFDTQKHSDVIVDIFYILALEAMVTIAQVAGRDEDGQYWAIRAHSTKRAMRERHATRAEGSFSLQEEVLMALAGISGDQEIVLLCKTLEKQVREDFFSFEGVSRDILSVGALAAWVAAENGHQGLSRDILKCLDKATDLTPDQSLRNVSLWDYGLVLEVLVAGGFATVDVVYEKPEPRIC